MFPAKKMFIVKLKDKLLIVTFVFIRLAQTFFSFERVDDFYEVL